MRRILSGVAVLACMVASGCGTGRESSRSEPPHAAMSAAPPSTGGEQLNGLGYHAPELEATSDKSAELTQQAVATTNGPTTRPKRPEMVAPVPTRRKIIRNGIATIEVASVDKSVDAVKALVDSTGGYTGNESASKDQDAVSSASITCRIPADKLDGFLGRVRALGKLESIAINGQDITEQYFDLEIRTANMKRLEGRLLDLLDRQTNRLSDLLEIEREVARVRGEIDQMEGRKRLWDNQVSFSTIVVNMHEPRPAVAVSGGGALRTLLRSFKQASENFIYTVSDMIAASGSVLPVLVLLLFVGWVVVKLWKRRHN